MYGLNVFERDSTIRFFALHHSPLLDSSAMHSLLRYFSDVSTNIFDANELDILRSHSHQFLQETTSQQAAQPARRSCSSSTYSSILQYTPRLFTARRLAASTKTFLHPFPPSDYLPLLPRSLITVTTHTQFESMLTTSARRGEESRRGSGVSIQSQSK